jgi:1,4-alpha-glucan branching enzyme
LQAALSQFDLHLFAEGTHLRAYDKLGAHFGEQDGRRGVHFAVWAPNATSVSVIGDFNRWSPAANPMRSSSAGVWEGFVAGLSQGAIYKYHVVSNYRGYTADKADPYGFASEIRPHTASRVWDLESYSWDDGSWMTSRARSNSLDAPISIYEVHLGSWRRKEGN